MPYIVNNTRGQIVAVIADGTINTSATSQTLVGKNVTPYGEYEVENLVHQLENFADSAPPGNPIEGQLWYNTTQEQMYAYSGEEWKPVSGLTVSTGQPALDPRQGDLWFDPATQLVKVYSPVTSGLAWVPVSKVTVSASAPATVAAGELYFNSTTKQLFASDGTVWNLIGPEAAAGFATTRWISTSLLDIGSVAHAVILGQVNGVTQAIVASDSFTILESVRPTGFVSLVPGINMASGSIVNGRAASADQLTTARTINGVLFDGTANITVPNTGELTAGTYLIGDPYSGSVPQTWRVNATPTSGASTVVARDSLGDFSARVITADLVGTVTGTATNVTGLVLSPNGGTGQAFYNLGEILIGRSNGSVGRGRVLAGQNISVNDTDGNITVSYTGGTGVGNVTSVGITTVGEGIGISGSPITGAGNITVTNTGVTRLNSGNGISTNSVNGNVTVTNTGVTRLIAGTNVILSSETGAITISTIPSTAGVSRIVPGTGVGISPPGGTGAVTINNTGVTRLVAGSNINLSAETGQITISASGGGGGPSGVTQVVAGTGLTGGTITTSGTIAVDSSVLRSNVAQSITALKTFTGGVISQAYNFTNEGASIFYADQTFGPTFPEPVVCIPVNNSTPFDYAHQFYRKRFVVEGSADPTTPGSTRPAGGAIMGIDNGIVGGAGVIGWHTRAQPGLGIGVLGIASNVAFTGDVIQSSAQRGASATFDCFNAYVNAYNPSAAVIMFQLRGDGNGYAAGSWIGSGADYAEYFESVSGTALEVGSTVVLEGNKIRNFQVGDDTQDIIGVIRPKTNGVSAMVGNAAFNHWNQRYLTDDFGSYVMEPHQVYQWEEQQEGEISNTRYRTCESHCVPDGVTIPPDATVLTHDEEGRPYQHRKENPNYDPTAEYTPREQRDEWHVVGLLGQIPVRKGQIMHPNWKKMHDISDVAEMWYIR